MSHEKRIAKHDGHQEIPNTVDVGDQQRGQPYDFEETIYDIQPHNTRSAALRYQDGDQAFYVVALSPVLSLGIFVTLAHAR